MARYVDADKLCEGLREMASVLEPFKQNTILGVIETIKMRRAADVVPTAVMEQIKWERDIAIEQLTSYGVCFGEKKELAEVKHGEWEDRYENKYYNHLYECSVCGREALYEHYKNELDQWKERQALTPICPYCSAKMDGGNAE